MIGLKVTSRTWGRVLLVHLPAESTRSITRAQLGLWVLHTSPPKAPTVWLRGEKKQFVCPEKPKAFPWHHLSHFYPLQDGPRAGLPPISKPRLAQPRAPRAQPKGIHQGSLPAQASPGDSLPGNLSFPSSSMKQRVWARLAELDHWAVNYLQRKPKSDCGSASREEGLLAEPLMHPHQKRFKDNPGQLLNCSIKN